MTVAVSTVLTELLVVMRTRKVWPDDIAPEVSHAPPLTLNCAVATPVTETASATVQPVKVIVAVLLVTTVLSDWLVRLVKERPLGAEQVPPLFIASVSQFVPSHP